MGQNAEATQYLISAIDRDESFDEAILLLLQVYLERNEKTQALNLYSNSIEETELNFQNKANYDLAKFFWLNGDYTSAQDFFKKINKAAYSLIPSEVELLEASISFAKQATDEQREIIFEELMPRMNGFDLQYFPSLDASGQLVFTARNKSWGGDEQILTTRDSAGGWAQPQMISEKINTDKNEGTAAISADGKTLVFTGCNRRNNIGSCDLYVAYKEGGEWQEPSLLPKTVNTRFWESQPSLNRNGQTLYFVSTQPGRGGQDIWVSQKINGEWTQSRPMDAINTTKDDSSPFIYPDDVTLFFASNGKPGLGRFDLFKTQRKGNSWAKPVNLGAPINDEQDQIGYCIGLDGWAYFSTTLPSGKIEMRRFKFPDELLPKVDLSIQRVWLVDASTKEPLKGAVNLLNADSTSVQMSSVAPGVFEEMVSSGVNTLIAQAPQYYTVQLEKPQDSVVLELQPYPIGEVVAGPIFFSSNEWLLHDRYMSEIAKVVKLALSYQDMVFVIEGYTDVIGNKEDNLALSKKRVETVKALLLERGVMPEQITVKYFGESQSADVPKINDDRLSDRKVLIRLIRTK